MTTAQLYASETTLDEARTAERLGDKAQAERLFKRAIEERAAAVGAADGSVGEFTYELGHFYYGQGNYQAAEETLKNAADIVEKAYYAAHAKLAPILDDLSDLYIKQNKLEAAEPVLVKLLDVVDKCMNGDHRYNFETMHKLGYVYRRNGKTADAEKILLKALKTIDTPLGPAEEFRLDLALVYEETGKLAEAETNMKLAIGGFEQRKNLPRLADALTIYSAFLNKQNRPDHARRAQELAEKIKSSLLPHHKCDDIFPATLLRA